MYKSDRAGQEKRDYLHMFLPKLYPRSSAQSSLRLWRPRVVCMSVLEVMREMYTSSTYVVVQEVGISRYTYAILYKCQRYAVYDPSTVAIEVMRSAR